MNLHPLLEAVQIVQQQDVGFNECEQRHDAYLCATEFSKFKPKTRGPSSL